MRHVAASWPAARTHASPMAPCPYTLVASSALRTSWPGSVPCRVTRDVGPDTAPRLSPVGEVGDRKLASQSEQRHIDLESAPMRLECNPTKLRIEVVAVSHRRRTSLIAQQHLDSHAAELHEGRDLRQLAGDAGAGLQTIDRARRGRRRQRVRHCAQPEHCAIPIGSWFAPILCDVGRLGSRRARSGAFELRDRREERRRIGGQPFQTLSGPPRGYETRDVDDGRVTRHLTSSASETSASRGWGPREPASPQRPIKSEPKARSNTEECLGWGRTVSHRPEHDSS